jgi:hypothetical protein
VVGWDKEQTVQLEGIADEPHGEELYRVQRYYFGHFPDGQMRLSWPGLTYFRIRPHWIRYSDFRDTNTTVAEFIESDLLEPQHRSAK